MRSRLAAYWELAAHLRNQAPTEKSAACEIPAQAGQLSSALRRNMPGGSPLRPSTRRHAAHAQILIGNGDANPQAPTRDERRYSSRVYPARAGQKMRQLRGVRAEGTGSTVHQS